MTPSPLAVYLEAVESNEALAKLIYETEESLRAKEDQEPGVWVPWESQQSRRERRIYYGIAAKVAEDRQRLVQMLRVAMEALNAAQDTCEYACDTKTSDEWCLLCTGVAEALGTLDRLATEEEGT